jgi:tetratricopeptide (TPR) repeat protein
MKNVARFARVGAVCAAISCLAAFGGALNAQPPAEPPPAKAPTPEEVSQAELLKSYLHVREQLHAAQLAIVNNRVEAEMTARVQAAAIAEKLEGIKAAMAAERERHQLEAQRLTAAREREQAETQRSIRTVLWVSAAFGAVGLIAMLFTPWFQWRTMKGLTEAAASRPQLTGPAATALLPGDAGPSEQAVTNSNQRLMTAVERMEKRIYELEHTATPAVSVTAATAAASPPATDSDAARRANSAPSEQHARIVALLAKGRSFLVAGKPKDAVACYNEILKIDINHPEALVRRGAALELLKQDEEAIQCYDRAIKADRKMTLAYLYKGGVCNRLERYEEALKCYEQALQVEEEDREVGAPRTALSVEDWPVRRG